MDKTATGSPTTADNTASIAAQSPGNQVFNHTGILTNSPDETAPISSPTVITDQNIRQNVVPDVTDRINGVSQNPAVSNADGTPYNSNNSNTESTGTTTTPYQDLLKEYGLTGTDQTSVENSVLNDPAYKSLTNVMTAAQKSNDNLSASTISGIQGKYNQLNATVVAQQNASTRGVQNSLLLGGGSQYAPISSEGVMSEKERYDIGTLADLQDKEDAAIAAAQNAHSAKDIQLAQTMLNQVDKLRSEKQAVATKINESLATTLNTQKTQQLQSAKDNVVANLVSKGITDIPSILTALKTSGYTATAKDITDTLTNISKNTGANGINGLTGNIKNFKILENMPGGLPKSIMSLPEEQRLGAYLQYIKSGNPTSGGSSGSGITSPTTGIVSEDVKAVLEGRNTLYNIRQTMGRSDKSATYMQNLRSQITDVDPNFDFIASDAGGKSVSTGYVQKATTAIDSVLPNIDKVVSLSDSVARLGIKGVDSLLQEGAIQIGNKNVSNFQQAQKLIADEIGTALGAGAMSDMKLKLGFDITDPSVKPEVFASNMKLVKDFIENRKKGLTDLRYKSSTSNTNPDDENIAKSKVIQYGATNPTSQDQIKKLSATYSYQEIEQILGM